jgi:DNA-binding CsgD family transcriptional regulator
MTNDPQPLVSHAYAILIRTRGDVDSAFGAMVAACGNIDMAAAITRQAWHQWQPAKLTRREREVLLLLASGQQQKDAARTMCISHRTVQVYVNSAMAKLYATNALHAVVLALQFGFIRLEEIKTVSISSANCG